MANLRTLIVKIGADATDIQKTFADVTSRTKTVKDAIEAMAKTPLGAQNVADLQRLTNNLTLVQTGYQKVADNSLKAAQGISAIGGPTRLASSDLDAMNKTLQKGLDVYRALGQEAPAELKKVADAIKQQQAALAGNNAQSSQGLLGSLAASAGGLGSLSLLGAAGAAGASFGVATKEALAYADTLTKLSDRTDIGVVALQRLDAIAKPSGNTLEEVANAVNKFQKNLAGGDASALAALDRLGLSFATLRTQSPDEQFIAIAKAIQGIQDPAQQTLLAMQLFGRGGAVLLPTLKAKVDELADSTTKMSAETVKALDDFGDALGRLKTDAINIAGEILAAFLKTAQGIKDAFPEPTRNHEDITRQPGIATAKGGAPPFRPDLPTLPQGLPDLQPFGIERQSTTDIFRGQNALPGNVFGGGNGLTPGSISAQGDEIAKVTAVLHAQQAIAEALGLTLEDYQTKLAAVGKKSSDLAAGSSRLTLEQKQQILAGQALGLSVEDLSIKLGIGTIAIKSFEDEVQQQASEMAANEKATGSLQQSIGKLAVGFDASGKAVVGFTGLLKAVPFGLDAVQAGAKATTDQLKELIQSGRTTAEVLARLGNATTTPLPNVSSPATDAIRNQESETERARRILGQIRQDELNGVDATVKWKDELSGLSAAFAHLAQVSGGTFANIVRDIGNVIVSLDVVLKGLHKFKDSSEHTDANGKVVPANRVGQVLGLVSAGAGFLQATSSKNAAAAAFGGAVSGAEIGFSLGGPIGAGVGAAAGFVVGLIRGLHKSEAQRLAFDVGRDLGVQISDGLAEALEADSNKFGRQATESLHLDQIIGEAGGVKTFGIDQAIAKTRDLFSFLQTGTLTITQVGDEFEKLFTTILPEAIDKTTGLAKASFVELIALSRQANIQSPAVQAFTGAQVNDNILGGLNSFLKIGNDAALASADRQLKALQQRLEAAQASGNSKRVKQIQDEITALENQQRVVKATIISTQDSATALGGAVFLAFEQLRENGSSITDALKAIQPTFDALEKSLKNSGFAGGAAFDALKPFFDIIKDPVVGPAIDAIDSLSKVLAGLNNIGRLDPGVVSGIGNQIGGIIDDLTKSGKNHDDIAKILQPNLQQLFEIQQRTGAVFDKRTQDLLDQAIKDGRVGEQFKSAQEREVTQQIRTNFLLERIGDKLGAVFLPTPKPTTPTPNPTPGDPGSSGDRPLPLAGGGRVTGTGAFGISQTKAIGQGRLLVFPDHIGSDTRPAMLQIDEFVLNGTQQANLRQAFVTGVTSDPKVKELLGASLGRGSLALSTFPSLGRTGFPVSHFSGGGRVLPMRSGGSVSRALPIDLAGALLDQSTETSGGDTHIHVDARGAWFDEQGVEYLSRRLHESVARGVNKRQWRKAVA